MVNCVICNGEESTALFQKNGYELVRCNQDGHIYVLNPPVTEKLVPIYSEAYFKGEAQVGYRHSVFGNPNKQFSKARRKLERLQRLVDADKILDVGCGPGFFVYLASEQYEATGVDISQAAADYAKNEFGLDVWVGDFLAFPETESYDAISMFSCLEHTLDPRKALKKANNLLKSGGTLLLSLPNIQGFTRYLLGKNWRGFSPPEHLHYFNETNLNRLVQETGFSPLESRLSENHFFRETIYFYTRKE